MDRTCKNHPDRTAKRKCFYCHENICSECQFIASHHIFCSSRCHRLFLFHSVLNNVKKWLSKIYIRVRDGFRGLGLSPVRLALDFILLIGLLTCILLLRSVIQEVGALKGIRPLVVDLSRDEEMVEPTEPTESYLSIDDKPQAMVLQNTIDINGESDNNIILSLSVNGKLTHVTLAKGGHFHFENVQLRRGSNKIVIRAVGEDGSMVMLEELNTFFGGPTFRYLSRSFDRGSLSKPQIALTFDGGAEENATADILNFLAEKDIQCTMFLTGAYIDRNKYLVRRMVEDGHEVANHTWNHPHLTTYEINRRHSTRPEVNRELVQSELTRTAQLFERITGQKMAPLWRAPYGEHNLQIRQWAAEIGFRHVGWTIGYGNGETMDTQDWVADTTASNYHSSQEILENILSFGEANSLNANGCIALMHLGTNRTSDQAHKIIPTLIDSLHARGYELVTASELLR
jgi:peptidoglycan/xylan/chitin deacetylase (PgdA/CDA1 family)